MDSESEPSINGKPFQNRLVSWLAFLAGMIILIIGVAVLLLDISILIVAPISLAILLVPLAWVTDRQLKRRGLPGLVTHDDEDGFDANFKTRDLQRPFGRRPTDPSGARPGVGLGLQLWALIAVVIAIGLLAWFIFT